MLALIGPPKTTHLRGLGSGTRRIMALAVSMDVTWTAGNRDEMVPHTYLPPHFSGAKETVMVHFMYQLDLVTI